MVSSNTKAMYVAIVAGVLLLISGLSGMAAWQAIEDFVTTNISDDEIVQYVFAILIFIASLGGLSVILGGLLIGKNKVRVGKILIMLGAGLGLIGLLFSITVAYMENNLTIGSFLSVGMFGLILSIIARRIAKNKNLI